MEKTQAELDLEKEIEILKQRLENKDIAEKRKTNELNEQREKYNELSNAYKSEIEKIKNELSSTIQSQVQELVSKQVSEIKQAQEKEVSTYDKLSKLNIDISDDKSKKLIQLIGIDKIAELSDEELVSTFGIKEIKTKEEKEEPSDENTAVDNGYDELGFLMY